MDECKPLVLGLYKGMVPNVLRVLPSSGVTFLAWAYTRPLFSST